MITSLASNYLLRFSFQITLGFLIFVTSTSRADSSLEKAQRLYSRIAGVKLSYKSPVLVQITNLIDNKQFDAAAAIALNSDDFYNVSLFQYFSTMSTRSESPDVPLNDFIAMGIANTFIDPSTQKDRSYQELVKGDFTVKINNQPLALTNNALLESAYKSRTVLTPQILMITMPQRPNFPDAAGVLTSRQFISEHAVAGTNRRMVHFAFREFLCTDIKEWRDADPNISDEYIARDVSRAPGGGVAGAAQFQTECRSCHQLMDGLRNAFAFHDFDSKTASPIYIPSVVASKINKNIEFSGGFLVTNDSWENKADHNANTRRFGWKGTLKGNGAKSFGEMIANSDKFSTCAVERVFKHVCQRALTTSEENLKLSLARDFESNNFSLRGLFKSVALTPACMQVGE